MSSLLQQARAKIEALSFYHQVPKDYGLNLEFRRRILREGSASSENAKQIWKACARDPLFWLACFGFIYEPRAAKISPFVPWPYQEEAIIQMDMGIGGACKDIVVEKSRDAGASWCALAIYLHRWLFKPMQAFLLLSRKEDLVDKNGDSDSLMWKLDFLLQYQPKWLLPFYDPDNDRKKLMLINRDNGSMIAGDSTTGDAGRGGRRTSIYLDEFAAVADGYESLAATADNTASRIFISTPQGTGNAFFYIRNRPATTIIRMHWSQHPEKSKGLYKDPETGALRSPWYDAECLRRHPHEVMSELDISWLGSSYQFFESSVIDRLLKTTVRTPYLTGDLEFDPLSLEVRSFRRDPAGKLRLWMHLDADGRPIKDDYFLAADVATGTGASPSVIAGGCRRTREKILEFADANTRPEDLGRYMVALARWLENENKTPALCGWEANGPGRNLGDKVVELGHKNIYFRRKEATIDKDETAFPGWWSDQKTKLSLIGSYRDALKCGDFVNPSADALEECRYYVNEAGSVSHSGGINSQDPTGARDNHGDRVVADALLHLIMQIKAAPVVEKSLEVPEQCLMFRRIRHQQRTQQTSRY